jgi:hypothetical protein
MGAEGGAIDQNDEQRELAKEEHDKAMAAHETAVEEFNAAQEALATAKANLAQRSDAYAQFGPNARPLTPAEILSPGEETCLMVFPHFVTLQANTVREDGVINGTRSATFQEGIREVPVSLQNHTYLISHNVMPYSGGRLEPSNTRANVTAEQRATVKATFDRETAAAQNDQQRAAAKSKYDAAVTVDVTAEQRAAAKVTFDRDTAAAQNDEQRAAAKTVYDRALVA